MNCCIPGPQNHGLFIVFSTEALAEEVYRLSKQKQGSVLKRGSLCGEVISLADFRSKGWYTEK